MSGVLRDVLDDVAAGEIGGLRIDLAAAAEQGRNRRARLRLVSSKVMLLAAAAAVVGLVLPVLLVVSTVRPAEKHPAAPNDWVLLAADRVPPVTEVRMDRARMLLAMTAPDGSTSDGMNSRPVHGVVGRGPVVLSADGRTYASLPYDKRAGNYVLSRDGRRVAWATVVVKARRATIVAHELTLSEGTVRTLTLPAETANERPTALFFDSVDGRSLVIFTRSVLGVAPKEAHLWSWATDATRPAVRELCSCLPTPFGLDQSGEAWQATNRLGYYPEVRRSPATGIGVPTWAGDRWGMDMASARLVVDNSGDVVRGFGSPLPQGVFHEGDDMPLRLTLAGFGGTRIVTVKRPKTGPAAAGTVDVSAWPTVLPLDWTPAGVVAVYENGGFDATRVSSLLLIDPDTGGVPHARRRRRPLDPAGRLHRPARSRTSNLFQLPPEPPGPCVLRSVTVSGGGRMGSESEFAQFVALRGQAMLRLAWLLTTDGPAAEDLVQDALARVLPRWSAIEEGRHEAYVRAAIRSVWIDGFRRRAARLRLDVVPEVPEVPAPDGGLEGTAVRVSVQVALARLTPRQRTVLVLRFYEDLTEAETARAMNCSTSTVKSQTRHALGRLRALAPDLESLMIEGVAR